MRNKQSKSYSYFRKIFYKKSALDYTHVQFMDSALNMLGYRHSLEIFQRSSTVCHTLAYTRHKVSIFQSKSTQLYFLGTVSTKILTTILTTNEKCSKSLSLHIAGKSFEHTVYCNSVSQQISEIYTYIQWYNPAINVDTIPHILKMYSVVLIISLSYTNLFPMFSALKNGIPHVA